MSRRNPSVFKEGKLCDNCKDVAKLQRKVVRYTVIRDTFYRRGYTLLLLRCVSKEEAKYILKEVHEWVCRSHFGGRILAHKATRVGYY